MQLLKNKIPRLLFAATILLTSCDLITESYFQGRLIGMAKKFNQKGPQLIAEGVRLDSLTVEPKKTLVYHYTMTKLVFKDIDTAIWNKTLDSVLLAEIKVVPDMKELRDHDVTFVYDYFDKNQQRIALLRFPPTVYKTKN
ncbi:MAG: hypothetical protein QM610_07175 [Chitinophagaceae bacterium]